MATAETAQQPRPVGGIHRKMLKLMELVGAIPKDRVGQGIRYTFRGIDDLYAALHPALLKAGVAMYPVEMPGTRTTDLREGKRQNGNAYAQTTVTFSLQVQFVDVDDGSSMFVIVPAQGVDDGDKAAGKAMSYGMKNALFHVLAIPTELSEDPDFTKAEVIAPSEESPAAPKRGPGRPKRAANAPEQSVADVTEAAKVEAPAAPAMNDKDMVATINKCETVADLSKFIDEVLRALPPDKQLEMAKVCRARRIAISGPAK